MEVVTSVNDEHIAALALEYKAQVITSSRDFILLSEKGEQTYYIVNLDSCTENELKLIIQVILSLKKCSAVLICHYTLFRMPKGTSSRKPSFT